MQLERTDDLEHVPALFVSPWIEASCFPSLLVSFHCDALWIRVCPVDVRREKARAVELGNLVSQLCAHLQERP